MRYFLALTFLVLAFVALAAHAEARDEAPACTRLVHTKSDGTGARYLKLEVKNSEPDASTDCPAASSATFTVIKGECTSWRSSVHTTGSPPSEPTGIIVYLYESTTNEDHGSSGADNWGGYVKRYIYEGTSQFNFYSNIFCATSNGDSSGSPTLATYRVVIRSCHYVPSSLCTSGAATYDINSDTGQVGNAGLNHGASDTGPGRWKSADSYVGDPLYITCPPVDTGRTASCTIKAEYDNGTARSGAASNITVYVQAPDGSYVLNGTNPTELPSPSGRGMGFYTISWTASQEGWYNVSVQSITSLNEIRTNKIPAGLQAKKPTLTAEEFRAYLDARFTPHEAQANATRARVNDTHDTTLNTQSYLSGRINQSHADTRSILLDVQNYLSQRVNTSGQETTTLLLAVQNYLATRQNETTSPLASATLVLSIQNYLATRQNETTSDKALEATLLTVRDEILENIQDANNTSSGALSFATWKLWRDGEYAPLRDMVNGTARQETLSAARNSSDTAHEKTFQLIQEEGQLTRQDHAAARLMAVWEHARPTTKDQAILLVLAGLFVVIGAATALRARSPRSRRKAKGAVLAGLLLAGAYLYALGLIA